MRRSSQVRVKRKGQMTIPSEIREKLALEEGALLEVEERQGTILLRPAPPVKGGEVVGQDAYDQVIRELDELRRDWR